MKTNYRNYFKNHYGYKFKDDDLTNYRNWFYSQWKIISKFIDSKNQKSFLEIGSGIGGFYQFIKDKKSYRGLDLDKSAVAFANRYWKKNIFTNIDFEKYQTREKYDYIFAFEVLEHLENPSSSIKRIYKALARNGIFIGTTPFPFEKNIFADETHLSVLHPQNWKRIFSQCGFSDVKIMPLSYFPYLWRLDKRLNIRIPFYIGIPGFVSTCLIIAKK